MSDNWQPIESAPKNNRILLYCKHRGIICGEWEKDEYAKKRRPYWTNDYERLFGVKNTRQDQPTHWQPLPPAPKGTR